MNAVHQSSGTLQSGVVLATLIRATVWTLLNLVRMVLLAVLGLCEPIVRVGLSLLSLAGLFTAALYYFAGSPGLKVSYGVLLGFSFGCALALALYERLLDILKR